MYNTNMIFLIFSFSLVLVMLGASMWIIMELFSPVTILFGSSSSRFPLRNFILFCVLLVYDITSLFGFTLTICVGMCTTPCFFTVASYVLVCFVFPPRFLLSSILSNLYSCTCGRSSFLSKSNILYFSFSFIAFSLMVVFCPVTSVKSKVLGRLLHFLRQICVIFITC